MNTDIRDLKRFAAISLCACFAYLTSATAHAQGDDSDYEYHYDFSLFDRLDLDYRLSPHSSDLFGDQYDNGTGTVRFEYTDVSLPGNFDIEVAFRRSYTTAGPIYSSGWTIPEIPRIEYEITEDQQFWPTGFKNGNHCSGPTFGTGWITEWDAWDGLTLVVPQDQFNQGFKLVIPGQTNDSLVVNDGTLPISTTERNYTTKSKWRITCIPQADGTGEGFLATSPNGITYTFDFVYLSDTTNSIDTGVGAYRLQDMVFEVSKVEDRFGNWVLYNRDSNDRLISITSSDNRTINIDYDANGDVDKVTANGREWTYDSSTGDLVVTRPDGKSWQYQMRYHDFKLIDDEYSALDCNLDYYDSRNSETLIVGKQGTESLPATPTITIEHPDGALGKFWLGYTVQGRTNVNPDPKDGKPQNSRCSYQYSLLKKSIDGPGLDESIWQYEYSQNAGQFIYVAGTYVPEYDITLGGVSSQYSYTYTLQSDMLLSGALPSNIDDLNYKWIKVIQPDGSYVKSYINRDAMQYYSDKVLAEEYFSTTDVKLKEIQNTYTGGTLFGLHFFGTVEFDERQAQTPKLIKSETILYDGSSPSSYTRDTISFDSYDMPTEHVEFNSFNLDQRYTRYGYYNDTTNWVLSQPTTFELSSNGTSYINVKETTYHSASGSYKSLPNCLYSFGREFSCNTNYFADGNVQRTEFNLANRWIEFANYKRGLPQTRTLPGRYQASNTISRTYVVDDNGWIEQITDFNGNTTNYAYNDAGWITLIDPADSAWANTSISYQDVTTADLAIPGAQLSSGQMKQTVSQGNYEKTIYHDAWLRQVLVHEEDITDSTTSRYTNYEYDYNNQTTFASYPSTSAGEADGVVTTYDALRRSTEVTHTAINSTTTQDYLAGNQIRTTDFNGNVTTTTYKAYGAPSARMATQIASPESVTTNIDYNLFNNITSVSQGGFTSEYIYDSYQLLCKMSRPETGWTYYDYNALYEATWSAEGQSSSNSNCDRSAVPANQRVTAEYDNLGGGWKTLFPDSTPDQIATLDNGGNLLGLTSGGADWAYTYNSRNLVETQTLSIDGKSFVLDPAYDSVGNLDSLVYPSGRLVNFSANGLGQAETVGDYVTDASYHPSGTVKTISYANGTTYSTSLNDRQLPRDMYVQAPDLSTLSDVYYSYDANANVTRIQDNLNATYTIDLDYDGLDRLIEADGYWGQGTIDYDTLGNIQLKSLGAQNLSYQYDNQNRLDTVTGSNPYSFNYDARGNVTNNGNRAFVYNLANQMTTSDGITYTYDGHNRRVSKTHNGNTDYSVYDQGGTLLYRQKANGDHLDYLYLGGRLVTTVESR